MSPKAVALFAFLIARIAAAGPCPPPPPAAPVPAESAENLQAIRDKARTPSPEWFRQMALPGHSMEMLPTGQDTLKARLDLIKNAQNSIYLTAFTFWPDAGGRKIAEALCRRGHQIDVRVMVDSIGSRPFFKNGMANWLRSCGVRVIQADQANWDLAKIFDNIHEKLLIADGKKVLMGGSNYGSKYENAARLGSEWHDLDAVITGPAACRFHRKFQEYWKKEANADTWTDVLPGSSEDSARPDRYREKVYGLSSMAPCTEVPVGTTNVLPLFNDPFFDDSRPNLDVHLKAIDSAHEIRLYAPYFVPGQKFIDALLEARKKGKKIVIYTNSAQSSDESAPITINMMKAVRPLIEKGVEIRVWTRPNTFHRKGGLFDNNLGFIGSDNLDNRGQEYSAESVAYHDDPKFLDDFRKEMDEDAKYTRQLTLEGIDAFMKTRSKLELFYTPAMKKYQ